MADGQGRALGFALLGAGAGAGPHAEALGSLAEARLVAVADPDLDRARRLAGRFGAVPLDDPAAALARADVAAVCIVAPNHLHAPLAAAAAQRGVAVLLEKPLARDLAEAEAVVATCRQHGVPFGLVLQNRFAPEVRALRDAVHDGRLGRLVGASVMVRCDRRPAYFRAGPWRAGRETAGGGALLIQGIHFLDLLDWIAGPALAVTAQLATRKHDVEVEDVLAATFELPGGVPAAFLVTTAAMPEFPVRLELFGTEGSAVLLEARGSLRLWWGGAPETLGELARLEGELAAGLTASWPAGTSADLHRALIADFVASLRLRHPPAVDDCAGLRLQAVVDATYRAARTGLRVEISACVGRRHT